MDRIAEIIKGCIDGKRKSQEQLYKLYSKKMFGLCLYYTKDYTAAEDIVQEGFVKIFKNIKQFKNKGSFEGWIRKIIINTALEKYRKQHHLYAVNDIENYAEDYSYDAIMDYISAKDLIRIIKELSPQYKMVFSLYAIEGYSHKEISEKLGISIGTSKSNLSRARVLLQKKIEKEFYPAISKNKIAT